MPCCKDVLPSIRQSTWSAVENNLFLFDAAAESALAVQVLLTHAHRLTRHSCSTFTFTDQPWHVARGRNNDEKSSSPCTCFSLLFFFFLLSDFEMLKNIVFKFLLLDFV